MEGGKEYRQSKNFTERYRVSRTNCNGIAMVLGLIGGILVLAGSPDYFLGDFK